MSATKDRPSLVTGSFSANLTETPGLPHNISVRGQVTGDYRVEDVHLSPARHQPSQQILVLDVVAKLGPVENPHSEIEKIIDVAYTHKAVHNYTEVEIVSGSQRETVTVIDIL